MSSTFTSHVASSGVLFGRAGDPRDSRLELLPCRRLFADDRSPLTGVDAALPVDRVDWSDLEFVKLAAYTRSAPLTPLHGCGSNGSPPSPNKSSEGAGAIPPPIVPRPSFDASYGASIATLSDSISAWSSAIRSAASSLLADDQGVGARDGVSILLLSSAVAVAVTRRRR